MDILDDMGVSKSSAKVNYSFKSLLRNTNTDITTEITISKALNLYTSSHEKAYVCFLCFAILS